MPATLGNFHHCFSKIVCPILATQTAPPPCPSPAASSPEVFKSFNSLFDLSTPKPLSSDSDDSDPENTPNFAAIYASQRFFFSSPGRSNSIIDSSFSSSSSSEREQLVDGSVAVPTFSPEPYVDFRQSMQEMVEARGLIDVKSNWDFLHKLLLCYLALNPKSTHKVILSAFADLVVSLMSSPPEDEVGR